jgi:peptide/nickel transport system ATP-binding protein
LYKERDIRINEVDTDVDVYQGCRFRARCPYVIDECSNEPKLEKITEEHLSACFVELD